MAYTLFLSHSSQDFDFVRAIQDAASPLRIAVYTYEQDLRPGDNLPQKLLERIRSCDAMIVLLTYSGAISPAVHQEIGAAKQANKLVIPLVDEGIDPKRFPLLQGTEYLVLNRSNPSETLQKLTGRLAELKNKADLNALFGFLIISALAIWAFRSN
jgi:hypothetical protein